MRKKAFTTLMLSVGAAALLLSGCSWTQRGAIAGGAVGAAVGAGWGQAASVAINSTNCGFIGAATGAAAGGLIGDQFDQAKNRGANRDLQNLRAQLTDRENELASLQSGNDPRVKDLQSKADDLQKQIDQMSTENQDLTSSVSSLTSDKDSLAQKKSDLEAQLAEVNKAKDQAVADAAKLVTQNATMTEQVSNLQGQIDSLNQEIATKQASLTTLQSTVQEKSSDVQNLKDQLSKMNVKLEETSQGLTLTILDQLLYKPGQASLSPEGKDLIARVGDIIQQKFPDREIIVEGHTDNQPIHYSKWTSNWELGAARALAVVHCMVQDHNFDPTKISAMSFGQFRPAADNSTPEGRSLNRRSVIVILPDKVAFQKQVASVNTP